MKYIIEYSSKEDLKYLRAYYSYSFIKYHIKSRFYESIVAGFVAFVVLQFRDFTFTESVYISFSAMLIMFLIYPYYNILKGYILIKLRGKGVPKKETYEIDLTESGLKFTGKIGESLWRWDQIKNIQRYKDFLLFEMQNKRLFHIPVSGFTSGAAFSDFSKHIELKFSKPT